MKHVLLVGCGNIGFRHLQALTSIEEIDQIHVTVVEPDSAQHARITEHAKTVSCPVEVLQAQPDGPRHFELVVIATNSNIRRKVFDAVDDAYSIDTVIFEKIVFQTITDHAEVAARLSKDGITGFVNCGRRGFPGYHALRDRLADAAPIHLDVSGASWALASNGIHFLDIAEFLNGSALTSINASGLAAGSKESKRGGYLEVFGTLTAELDNGARVSLTCRDELPVEIAISLSGETFSAKLDEAAHTAELSIGELTETLHFQTHHVSGMPHIYSGALFGDCPLTPFADAAHQHRLYLTALRTHLGLSNERDAPCPIS